MRKWDYHGITFNDEHVRGRVYAESYNEAVRRIPVFQETIYVKDRGPVITLPGVTKQVTELRVKPAVVAETFRQIKALLETGYSNYVALDMLSRYGDRRMCKIAAILSSEMTEGRPLSDACALHSGMLGSDFSSQIRAGEDSATLPNVLESIAAQITSEVHIKKKIQSAMMYPAIVGFLAVVIGGFLMLYIMPLMAEALTELDTEMPWITQACINFSAWLRLHIMQALLGIAMVIILGRWLIHHPLALVWDSFKMRIPLIGKILISRDVVYLFRYLGFAANAGIPIHVGLASAIETIHNKKFKQDLITARGLLVNQALELHTALNKCKAITGLQKQTIAVGVTTGKIGEMLLKLAISQEEDLNNATDKMAEMVGPAMVIVIGIMVGILAVAIYAPMMSVITNIG